jgi:hypothetical protein
MYKQIIKLKRICSYVTMFRCSLIRSHNYIYYRECFIYRLTYLSEPTIKYIQWTVVIIVFHILCEIFHLQFDGVTIIVLYLNLSMSSFFNVCQIFISLLVIYFVVIFLCSVLLYTYFFIMLST